MKIEPAIARARRFLGSLGPEAAANAQPAAHALEELPGKGICNQYGCWGDPAAPGAPAGPRTAAPAEFKAAFSKAFPAGSPFENHVTHYTEEQLAGMTCLLSPDGKAGVAVHDHGDGRIEATALFNNGGEKGAGLTMLAAAIDQGVNYVECYGPALNAMYEKLGFQTTEQYPFDPAQAAPGWDSARFDSPPYHVMRMVG